MKTTNIIILFLLLLNSQTVAQIINGDFEQWVTESSREVLLNWETNDNEFRNIVNKIPSTVQGNFAAKIVSNGPSIEGVAPGYIQTTIANHFTQAEVLSFWLQCDSILNGGFCVVQVLEKANEENLLGEYKVEEEMEDYQRVNLPLQISEDIDSLIIRIEANTTLTPLGYEGYSELLIDNIAFDIKSNIKEENHCEIQIYPNPTSDFIRISFDTNKLCGQVVNVNLYESSSKLIRQFSNSDMLYIGDLNAGVYFLELKSENSSYRKKIIIK